MPDLKSQLSVFGLIFGWMWINLSAIDALSQSPAGSAADLIVAEQGELPIIPSAPHGGRNSIAGVNPIPNTLMCIPGELVFREDFEPASVSPRWGFKSDFALRNGGLQRTNVRPKESKRVFLKDTLLGNAIIQFDFRFAGDTTDLRFVTGSGGHYNSVTKIRPNFFQVETASDKEAGIVAAYLGECRVSRSTERWQTMTIEYWNDEIVSHLSADNFVIGVHPIIDRTREYFAFQFDRPGASIDNVRIWSVAELRDGWETRRNELQASQSQRKAIQRSPVETYKIEYTKVKSYLTLTDPVYRDLVAKHSELQSKLRAKYSRAFITHKQLNQRTAETKRKLKATDPEFKRMETKVHRSARDEDAYLILQYPSLVQLKEDGIPKQRYASELGQARAKLEAAGDEKLAALVLQTAAYQRALEKRFPEAFQDIDLLIEKRKEARKSLNHDPAFQAQNKAVVEAGKAVKQYEQNAAPMLVELAAKAKAAADAGQHSPTQ
jgi:hypothetical protein